VRCPCAPASRICPSTRKTTRTYPRIPCVSRGREKCDHLEAHPPKSAFKS
jgi:hypothetical protein